MNRERRFVTGVAYLFVFQVCESLAEKNTRRWCKLLLWLHLFLCLIWLYMLLVQPVNPGWIRQLFYVSISNVQLTWGFTVGLIVGPSRKRRTLLWASLLLVFMPLWVMCHAFKAIWHTHPMLALIYLVFSIVVETLFTWIGVFKGVQAHSKSRAK